MPVIGVGGVRNSPTRANIWPRVQRSWPSHAALADPRVPSGIVPAAEPWLS